MEDKPDPTLSAGLPGGPAVDALFDDAPIVLSEATEAQPAAAAPDSDDDA